MRTKVTGYRKLTIRQPTWLKRMVERAAGKRGTTVTSFINNTLARAAEPTLAHVRRRELSDRDQKGLLEMLANPEGPSEGLIRAARRYRERYCP
jgi:uncharacterized protein (DUF1778 family)